MKQAGFILLAVILYISAAAQQKIASPKQDFKHLLSPAHQAFLKGNPGVSFHSSAYKVPSVTIADRPGLSLFNNVNVPDKVTIQYYHHTQTRFEDFANLIGPLLQSMIGDGWFNGKKLDMREFQQR